MTCVITEGREAVGLKLVYERCLGAYAVGVSLVLVLGAPLGEFKAYLRALIDGIDHIAEYRQEHVFLYQNVTRYGRILLS